MDYWLSECLSKKATKQRSKMVDSMYSTWHLHDKKRKALVQRCHCNHNLWPETQVCDHSHASASADTFVRPKTHYCVYSHTFATTNTCPDTCYFLRLHICIWVPKRRNGSSLFSLMRTQTSDLDSFALPLPFTSSLSPFLFLPSPLQHQQGLATLVV
jgi:hypothetical protein